MAWSLHGDHRAPTSGATGGTETVCLLSQCQERELWLATAYSAGDWNSKTSFATPHG